MTTESANLKQMGDQRNIRFYICLPKVFQKRKHCNNHVCLKNKSIPLPVRIWLYSREDKSQFWWFFWCETQVRIKKHTRVIAWGATFSARDFQSVHSFSLWAFVSVLVTWIFEQSVKNQTKIIHQTALMGNKTNHMNLKSNFKLNFLILTSNWRLWSH